MKNFLTKRLFAIFLVVAMIITSLSMQDNTVHAASKTIKSISLVVGTKNVTKKTFKMTKGKSKQLKAIVKPASSKKSVTYQSKNKKIVTVSKKGKLTAKKVGTAKIIVKVKGKKGKLKQTWVKIKVTKKKKSTDNNVSTGDSNTADTDAPSIPIVPNEPGEIRNPELENNTTSYTVTFDLNYESAGIYKTISVIHGQKVVRPEAPSRKGSNTFDIFAFDYWSTDVTGNERFDFDTAITSNIVLYAQWDELKTGSPSVFPPSGGGGSSSGGSGGTSIPAIIYYEITFVSSGVSDAENMPVAQTIKSGERATAPSIPIRNGYIFDGWYVDEELTSKYDFNTIVTTNITLYAKWTPVNPLPVDPDAQCKVTFVLNDGSDGIYETQMVNINETIHEPSTPVREQYRFTGWYTEAETATEYNFDTPVTGNFILYAGWGNPDGSNEGIYSVSSGGGTEASISGIERSADGVVYVTLNTPEPSTVVVEFLDETEFWNASEGTEADLLAIQGIATQTPNYCEMEAVSIPLEDVSDLLPQYYVLRASLYGQNGDELCNPYYSVQYTSIYEKFDNLTYQDRINEYGPDRVIAFDTEEPDSNYGVFAKDVKIVEVEDNINILTVEYEFSENSMFPTTTYRFANPSADTSALQKGDKLYATDKDGYPQLFKVGTIQTTNDGSVVITPAEDVILSDFYTVLKVDMDGTRADVQVQNDIQPQLEIIDVNQTFSKAISYSINWKPLKKEDDKGNVTGDWLTLTGSVGGKATLSIKLAWDAKLFEKDQFEASVSLKVEATLKASINATGGPSWDATDKVNAEWKAGKVSIPTNIPGLTLFLETSVPVDLKFSGTGTLSATATLEGGFSFDTTSGFHPKGKAELKSEVNFTAQAELKAGPKVAIGVAFAEKIVKADASVQAGIKATVSGSVGAQATTGDSKHGCSLCLKGDIKWFKNAKTSISYDITKKLSAKYEKTIYESETALGIGKVYLSLIHSGAESVFVDKDGNPKTGPVFGWGDCPNQVWRTIFEAKDSGGNDVAIALNVNRQDGKIKKSGTTSFNEFLNNGVYIASGEIDGLTVQKSFTVNGAKQTVILTPISTDRSLSGIITDADTSNAIEEANIIAKQNDMIVASTKSSANGTYTLNLPEGDYVLEVSKTNYVTNTVHVTILNDRETYQNVELTCGETGKGGFSGRIVDASSGVPIEGVQLEVRSGWNASSDNRVVLDLETNANGEYKYEKQMLFGHVVGLAAGGYTVTASKEGYNTKSFNITVLPNVQNNRQPEEPLSRHIQVESGSYRIVLTWGANPRDLDSHVVGQLNSGNDFHVYFSHKNQKDGNNVVCNLDRDDTRGNGTETIILNPQNDQPYYYYIYKYAGSSDIAHSGAHIDVYDSNGLIDSFNAPTNQGSGEYWNVFAIVDGQLIIRNTITPSSETSYASTRKSTSDLGTFTISEIDTYVEDNETKAQ